MMVEGEGGGGRNEHSLLMPERAARSVDSTPLTHPRTHPRANPHTHTPQTPHLAGQLPLH